MDKAKIEAGVRLILEGIGNPVQLSDLEKTPGRVAEMLSDVLSGYSTNSQLRGSFSESISTGNLVSINNISFYSVCEHHLLPFFGKVNITYAPRNGKIAGFSGFSRIVDAYARRLQVQERMTQQIAEAIQENLDPLGVSVRVTATQLCASMRGQHAKPIRAVTHCQLGNLPKESPRQL